MLTLKSVVIAALLLLQAFGHAFGQSSVKLNVELLRLAIKVCWDIGAARTQSELSVLEAKQSSYSIDNKYLSPGCEWRESIVLPTQPEFVIDSYVAWTPVYDPKGDDSSTAIDLDGKRHKIPFTLARRKVAFYRAIVSTKSGFRSGWVELADEPYVLTYLEATKSR